MTTPRWLQTGWATHTGRRSRNEDAVLVSGALMAVADGVGGAPRGDLASLEAIEALRDAIDEPDPDDPHGASVIASELDQALNVADDAVKALADHWSNLRGAATTMCAALVFIDPAGRGRAVIANVGDSRCYQIRNNQAHQITRDQTLAQHLQQAGIDPIDERAHNIVTSVLGGPPDSAPDIDLYRLDLQPDAIILICTDGISGVLDPDQLAHTCTALKQQPNKAAAALVRAAWDANSSDNLTAAVAHMTDQLHQPTV